VCYLEKNIGILKIVKNKSLDLDKSYNSQHLSKNQIYKLAIKNLFSELKNKKKIVLYLRKCLYYKNTILNIKNKLQKYLLKQQLFNLSGFFVTSSCIPGNRYVFKCIYTYLRCIFIR